MPRAPVVEAGRFVDRIVLGVLRDLHDIQSGNADPWRQSSNALGRAGRQLADFAWRAAGSVGFVRRGYGIDEALAKVEFILTNRADFDRLYEELADERSRDLLQQVLKFRILGNRHVKLALNAESYWSLRRRARALVRERGTATVAGQALHQFVLGESNGSISLHAQDAHVLNTFLLEQYSYRNGLRSVSVVEGDIVIDLGGGWGDTALYFAERVGAAGHVYAFECMAENQAVFQRNLDLNPALASRITLVPAAAWSRSGETIRFTSAGPSSRANGNGSRAEPVRSLAIDDFVRDAKLARVDFIKMDIEGSECPALRGAQTAIRTSRPRLAVSLYHRDEDFVEIPRLIRDSGVGFDLLLDHFTIFDEETVLFATPRP